jgi:hypothetical protein
MWAGLPGRQPGCLSKDGTYGAEVWPCECENEGSIEAETQVDILGEVAEIDPDFDGLVEKCCEWVERDVIQPDYD